MKLKAGAVLLIFAALGAYYLLRIDLPREEREQQERLLFFPVSEKEISSIKICRSVDQCLTLNQQSEVPGRWGIASIPGAVVTGSFVEQVQVAVAGNIIRERVGNASEYEKKKFGFGDKSPLITVQEGGGKHSTVLIGNRNEATGHRYYWRVGMDDIVLAEDKLIQLAHSGAAELRERFPIEFEEGSVDKIELSDAAKRYVFERRENLGWKATEPLSVALDPREVQEFFSGLRGSRVFTYHEKGDREFGFEQPLFSVVLTGSRYGEPFRREYVFGQVQYGDQAHIYLMISNRSPIFRLMGNPKNLLFRELGHYREKRQSVFSVSSATSVEVMPFAVSGVSRTERFVREGSRWTDSGKNVINAAALERFLKLIGELRAERFPETTEQRELLEQRVERERGLLITVSFGDGAAHERENLVVRFESLPTTQLEREFIAVRTSQFGEVFEARSKSYLELLAAYKAMGL